MAVDVLAVPMAVCLPKPQPSINSLMFAMLLFLLSRNYGLLAWGRRRRGNLMPPGDHERRERFGGRFDFLHFTLGRSHVYGVHLFPHSPPGLPCSTSVACTSK